MGRCKGCGSTCGVPGCAICRGRQVCTRCAREGKQIIQGRLVVRGVVADSPVPPAAYKGETYRL